MDWFLDKLDKFATWLGRDDPFLGMLVLAVVAVVLIVVLTVISFSLVSFARLVS